MGILDTSSVLMVDSSLHWNVIGQPVQDAGAKGLGSGNHTVSISFKGFVGRIWIEATLADNPQDHLPPWEYPCLTSSRPEYINPYGTYPKGSSIFHNNPQEQGLYPGSNQPIPDCCARCHPECHDSCHCNKAPCGCIGSHHSHQPPIDYSPLTPQVYNSYYYQYQNNTSHVPTPTQTHPPIPPCPPEPRTDWFPIWLNWNKPYLEFPSLDGTFNNNNAYVQPGGVGYTGNEMINFRGLFTFVRARLDRSYMVEPPTEMERQNFGKVNKIMMIS